MCSEKYRIVLDGFLRVRDRNGQNAVSTFHVLEASVITAGCLVLQVDCLRLQS